MAGESQPIQRRESRKRANTFAVETVEMEEGGSAQNEQVMDDMYQELTPLVQQQKNRGFSPPSKDKIQSKALSFVSLSRLISKPTPAASVSGWPTSRTMPPTSIGRSSCAYALRLRYVPLQLRHAVPSKRGDSK